MLTLIDLINAPEGQEFLELNGILVSREEYKARLKTPANSALTNALGVEKNKKIVFSGQQLYIDYRQSVLSKVSTACDLEKDPELSVFFLWLDTDRSGSDSLITKFAWPTNSKKGTIGIAPSRTRDIELRFVALDAIQLRRAIDKLGTHLRQSGVNRKGAKLKYQQLRAKFVDEEIGILSHFNHQITSILLNDQFECVPRSIIASEIINSEFVIREINLFLNNMDEVIRVFNETVDLLLEKGIDPQLKHRKQDYLPLFYSCDQDGQRFRLHHIIEGGKHIAIGACRSRHIHKFNLGKDVLSIDSLAQTGRWSPDVFLPGFLNDLVSGFVAGKSSALYLIVLNAVLKKVLHKSPVPVLVPENLAEPNNSPDQIDSLIYSYFNAK
jgi:hypothetical protein